MRINKDVGEDSEFSILVCDNHLFENVKLSFTYTACEPENFTQDGALEFPMTTDRFDMQ